MGTSTHFERLFVGLDPRRPTPLYEQIASCIRVAVATGDLNSGDALPSVRLLAATLRVNPSTVVTAYRDLEREGFVYTKRGSGTFVAAMTSDARATEQNIQALRLIDDLLTEAARLGISADTLFEAFKKRAGATTHV